MSVHLSSGAVRSDNGVKLIPADSLMSIATPPPVVLYVFERFLLTIEYP